MMFASSSHVPRPSFHLNRFFNFIINLTAMIRGFCVKPAWSKFQNLHSGFSNPHGDFKSAWRNSKLALRVFILLSAGRHFGLLLLAVKSSYCALFSLIVCVLDVFLDANCSSSSILAFCHYEVILGWIISAAQ